jgi:hypothetical protein
MFASMMRSEARWNSAVAAHEAAVRDFVAACERCSADDWQRSADGKWSTAAVALHICNAYEVARDAMTRGVGMRMRVSQRYAWFLRNFVLPIILATTRFPRARAPREVVPDENETKLLTRDAAMTRLTRVAREASDAFRNAASNESAPRMTHAYFGALDPYTAFRLITAHTRHHTRALARR